MTDVAVVVAWWLGGSTLLGVLLGMLYLPFALRRHPHVELTRRGLRERPPAAAHPESEPFWVAVEVDPTNRTRMYIDVFVPRGAAEKPGGPKLHRVSVVGRDAELPKQLGATILEVVWNGLLPEKEI
ncbi:MAG: hypothetical protein K0U78_16285 [Actinomycetia bacterium]|nr:hypothetical protein [Actinomycetes bacterium]